MPEIPDLSRHDQRRITRERIHRLVDKDLFHNDAAFRATVAMFERWLLMTEDAMREEGVDESVIRAVLNRVIYGAPYATDPTAYERVAKMAEFRVGRPGDPPRTPSAVLEHLGIVPPGKQS